MAIRTVLQHNYIGLHPILPILRLRRGKRLSTYLSSLSHTAQLILTLNQNVWPNSTNKVPGARGVGLTKALNGYAKWFTETLLPGYCESYGYFEGDLNTECFQGLNASNPIYTDLTPGNAGNRQWNWMLCNEA